MSFPTLSNISQHDVNIPEIQQQHEKEQQLLVHLEEVVETYHVKCIAQKARREVKAKTREEAKKTEAYRREKEEETVRVYPTTLE